MGMLLARALDDPGDVLRPRDEHEMPSGQFGHARMHPLRHEALELRIDCAILRRDDVPRRHGLPGRRDGEWLAERVTFGLGIPGAPRAQTGTCPEESGGVALNHRPPGPEPGALTGMRYAPRLRKVEADEPYATPRGGERMGPPNLRAWGGTRPAG